MSLDGLAQSQREDEVNTIIDGIYNYVEGEGTDILEPLIKKAIDNGLDELGAEAKSYLNSGEATKGNASAMIDKLKSALS